MILPAGIHTSVLAEVYHADPCEAPSLSAHDAETLIARTPLHAWAEHPKNPEREPPGEATSEQDEGSALHALLLERQDRVEPVRAKDWKTKAAKEARASARAVGRVPILADRWDALRRCADAFRRQIKQHEIGDVLARPGRPEVTIIWQDEAEHGPIWCRQRTDWLTDDGSEVMLDLKTLGGSAIPDAWARQNRGAPIRAAHYLRGGRAVGMRRPRYLFALLERNAPFMLSVCDLSPALLTIGEEQHGEARNIWSACLSDGVWPGFPPFVATIEADNGLIYRHEDWRERQAQQRQRKPRPFAEAGGHRVVNSEQPFA